MVDLDIDLRHWRRVTMLREGLSSLVLSVRLVGRLARDAKRRDWRG